MLNTKEIDPTVEELYNQAANEGTLDAQLDGMAMIATEAGTTIEALRKAREQRNADAAKKIAVDPNIIAGGNDGDHWRNNED